MKLSIEIDYNRKTQIDARKLNEKGKQLLRMRAWTMVKVEGCSPDRVAAVLGVSHTAVHKWLARGEKFGPESLTEEKETSSRNRSRLTDEQIQELIKTIETSNPRNHGYGVVLWTRVIVTDLILRLFGVKYNPGSVGQLLKRVGLSPQKPVRISYRQNAEEVEAWRTEVYPEIEKKAADENAVIVWIDESTVCSSPDNGTTWAKKGKTPVVRVLDSTERVNVIGALDCTGKTNFMVFNGKMNSTTFCTFIENLMEKYSGKVFLILDNASYHKSGETLAFMQENRARLTVFFCPFMHPISTP